MTKFMSYAVKNPIVLRTTQRDLGTTQVFLVTSQQEDHVLVRKTGKDRKGEARGRSALVSGICSVSGVMVASVAHPQEPTRQKG